MDSNNRQPRPNDVGGGGRYLSIGPADRDRMLAAIGGDSIDDLFEPIPPDVRFGGLLDLEPALAELPLTRHLEELSAASAPERGRLSFLGAGCNPHFVPSHVDAMIQRQEYMTAYTPYQGEVGQGTLQSIFEFQSLVCMLSGMEVANASVYDGASSVAEAVLMVRRMARKGGRVLLSEGLHPAYAEVTRTYAKYLDLEFETLPLDDVGRTVLPTLDAEVLAVVIQQPNFFGVVEDLRAADAEIGPTSARFVVASTEPLALAVTAAPGDCGADLVVGELQSFGNAMSFGGPMVGFMACRDADKRNLPGRLSGQTVDAEGKRGFVLTLSTREQHIRREKATSNICTNEALCALAACVHMASLGRSGADTLARHNLAKATYAAGRLEAAGFPRVYTGPIFNELTVRLPGDAGSAVAAACERGVIPGVALGRFDSGRADQLLVCTTEVHARADIDRLVDTLQEVAR